MPETMAMTAMMEMATATTSVSGTSATTTPRATRATSAEVHPTSTTRKRSLVTTAAPTAANGSVATIPTVTTVPADAAEPSATTPMATRAAKRSAGLSSPRKRITLHVKTPGSEIYTLMMVAETTVGVFKRHIMHATNIAPGEQRLVYDPFVLRDSSNSLEPYSLQHHSVVHMTLCLRES